MGVFYQKLVVDYQTAAKPSALAPTIHLEMNNMDFNASIGMMHTSVNQQKHWTM